MTGWPELESAPTTMMTSSRQLGGVAMTPEPDLLTVTAADGQDLLTAAEGDWSRPVPDCPGWTAADLVGHMGAILGWMAKIVTTGEAVPRRERETPPADQD